MKFLDFVKRKEVRRTGIDMSLFNSLLETADSDLKFLDKTKIDEFSARKIMSNYYDVLRSILEAMALKDGYKVYSHEAFTFYLKEKGEGEIALKFDRFRRKRNKINYYGENISIEEVEEYSNEIKQIIKELNEKYLK
ncbi:hypothetical protein CL616_00525 [archaeon]|nr:hypothetical protein [archaeon]|tara:strand:+ start:712 stop:1122 length:411 start_codon:yes stop_codon:yes gene_type:complete